MKIFRRESSPKQEIPVPPEPPKHKSMIHVLTGGQGVIGIGQRLDSVETFAFYDTADALEQIVILKRARGEFIRCGKQRVDPHFIVKIVDLEV